jgi:hypothetical protein
MFGSWVLEVAIGLIFVFLLFSTICAGLREGIEALTKTRAAYLERGVREMLHDKTGKDLAKQFYEHPLILSLYSAETYTPGSQDDNLGILLRGDNLPSYIPAKSFAAALIDLAARGPLSSLTAPDLQSSGDSPSTDAITAESLRAGIAKMENRRVARALLNALDLAQNDLNKACLNLEDWFDACMDRVSGWYKRSTQWIIFGLALIMAGVLNVDAIGIANFLYQNDTARNEIVVKAKEALALGADPREPTLQGQVLPKGTGGATTGMAIAPPDAASQAAATPGDSRTSKQKFDQANITLGALDLPIGWPADFERHEHESRPRCVGRGALIVLGWLLTAFAATLGAPFWFDTLNKIMVIRSTVKPYEKSKPEASEDRQKSP